MSNRNLLIFGLLGSLTLQETTAFVAGPPRRGLQHRVHDTALPVSASEDLIRLNEPNGDGDDDAKKKDCPEERLKFAFENETPETVGMLYPGILNYESGTESISPPLSSTSATPRKSTKAATTAAAGGVVTEKMITKNKRKMKSINNKSKRNDSKNKMKKQEQQQQKRKRLIKNKNHRRHDFEKRETFLKEQPDLDFYTLHSSAVSHLHKDMPIDDIT